jgi:hypothetical protein
VLWQRATSPKIPHAADINELSLTNRLAASAVPFIVTHSINSTVAGTLKSALVITRKLRAGGSELVLVASDQRLLRAAGVEG